MGGSYAGVDWASEKHDVLVADAAGGKLLAATFAHDEPGLRSLCRQLVRLKVALVAVERPDGLLVERLLDAGLRALALHRNQVAAARVRFRVSGGKSDHFDAFVLCSRVYPALTVTALALLSRKRPRGPRCQSSPRRLLRAGSSGVAGSPKDRESSAFS